MDFEIWSMCQTSHGSWSEKKNIYFQTSIEESSKKS